MAHGDLQAAIENAVKRSLAPAPLQAVDIELGHDSDDDEALFVTVTLPAGTPLVGGEKYAAAMIAVSNLLLDAGDQRIPYVRLHHVGELEPDEGEGMLAAR